MTPSCGQKPSNCANSSVLRCIFAHWECGSKLDLSRNSPRMIKHLYLQLIAAIMDSDPPAIQAALSFTQQPSANLDAALDVFGRIDCLDANCEALSWCIPYSSTWPLAQFLARLLPVTDSNTALVCQTEYWMSFIYQGALALYSVAMFASMHTCKKMKNSAAIRAVLTRLSSVSSLQNQAFPVAMYRSLNSVIKAMVARYWKQCIETLHVADEDPLRAEWLLAATLLASGLAATATGSVIQSHPSTGLTFLVAWVREIICCGALWLRLGVQAAETSSHLEDWDNMVRVDSTSVAVGR